MRVLPNMTVMAPADADEIKRLRPATIELPGPAYIRLAKGGDPVVTKSEDGFEIGKAIELKRPGEVVFITTGIMSSRALIAAEMLSEIGVSAGVIHVHTIKPLDEMGLLERCSDARQLVVVEEHTTIGGLGNAVTDCITRHLRGHGPKITCLGIPDVFASKYGTQDDLLKLYGLQPKQLFQTVCKIVNQIQAA